MTKLSFIGAALAMSFVFSSFLFSENKTFAADSGRGFTVAPPVFELKANPGDNLVEVVSVFNSGNENISIVSSIENLKPIGEQGQVQVIGGSEEGLPSPKEWIKVKNGSFDLAKGTTKNVDFEIDVPANAEPGGHFATILFGTTNSKIDQTGSQLSQKIGALILLTVTGQTKESATITHFSPAKKFYLNNQAILFDLKIIDTGNVYIRPRGFLVITDLFGRNVAQIETDGKNILPSATRQIPLEFKSKHLFGPYTATLTLIYGNTNQNLTSTTGFWVIPWLSSLITVVVLFSFFMLRRRFWRALLILIGREK